MKRMCNVLQALVSAGRPPRRRWRLGFALRRRRVLLACAACAAVSVVSLKALVLGVSGREHSPAPAPGHCSCAFAFAPAQAAALRGSIFLRRGPLPASAGFPARCQPQSPVALSAYRGWEKLKDRRSWLKLLEASSFTSDDEATEDLRPEQYRDNLEWTAKVLAPEPETDLDNDTIANEGVNQSVYPAVFTSYLSRLLLSRDKRCAGWWAGARNSLDETPEVLFARFEASLAETLSRNWSERPGALAALLINRFGGRFPFDAEKQIKLLFSLLPPGLVRESLFEQDLITSRDELMEVFLAIDADGNGVLTRQELRSAFAAFDDELEDEELEEMLVAARADGAGEIAFAGFKSAVLAVCAPADNPVSVEGCSDEWWRDPVALLPARFLDDPTPEMIEKGHAGWLTLLNRVQKEEEDGAAPLEGLPVQPPPLQREQPLSNKVYALFAIAGANACTLTHMFLVPLDVIKTLQQTDPAHYGRLGLFHSACKLARDEGPAALMLGTVPTLLGYAWYGATVFPAYECFKRRLLAFVGPRIGSRWRVPIVLLAGALATFIACIGVCPAEAVRILTVKEAGFSLSFLSSPLALFAGFGPLLFRQVLFGMAKFLVFDMFSAEVFKRFPKLGRKRSNVLLVSLLSGALAGAVGTFISQPSDAILTRLALEPSLGIGGAARAIWREGMFTAFFSGLRTRSIWAAAIIAGQFLLYDIGKDAFKVTPKDLTQTADVLGTALPTKVPSRTGWAR